MSLNLTSSSKRNNSKAKSDPSQEISLLSDIINWSRLNDFIVDLDKVNEFMASLSSFKR